MSKVYEALKRLEAKREATRAPDRRIVRTGWKGVALGFAGGLGAAGVAVALLIAPEKEAPVRDAVAPAPHVAAPEAVASRPPLEEAPSLPPSRPSEESPADEEAPSGAIGEEVDQGEALADVPAEAAPEPPAMPAAPAPVRAPGGIWVQVGTFRNRDNATRLAAKLEDDRYPAAIVPSRSAELYWVVRVGAFPDRSTAEATRVALDREGLSGFIVTDRR